MSLSSFLQSTQAACGRASLKGTPTCERHDTPAHAQTGSFLSAGKDLYERGWASASNLAKEGDLGAARRPQRLHSHRDRPGHALARENGPEGAGNRGRGHRSEGGSPREKVRNRGHSWGTAGVGQRFARSHLRWCTNPTAPAFSATGRKSGAGSPPGPAWKGGYQCGWPEPMDRRSGLPGRGFLPPSLARLNARRICSIWLELRQLSGRLDGRPQCCAFVGSNV